jgi:hypothetical protein
MDIPKQRTSKDQSSNRRQNSSLINNSDAFFAAAMKAVPSLSVIHHRLSIQVRCLLKLVSLDFMWGPPKALSLAGHRRRLRMSLH